MNKYFTIKIDENLRRAHKRDAVLDEKFYFRKDIISGMYLARLLLYVNTY